MIARLLATVIMLLLAFAAAFWGYSLGFALMFLFVAAVTWFKWEIIRDGFAAAKAESQMPIIRLSANMIGGLANMFRGERRRGRRSSSSNA